MSVPTSDASQGGKQLTKDLIVQMHDKISGVGFFGAPFLPMPPILAFEELCDLAIKGLRAPSATACRHGIRWPHECPDCERELAERLARVPVEASWIPVSERKPEPHEKVLVTPGYGEAISIDFYVPEYDSFLMRIEDGRQPTHWMLLPSTPTSTGAK